MRHFSPVLLFGLIFLLSFFPVFPAFPQKVFAQANYYQSKGDANGDLTVDGLDYIIWLNQYGTNVSPSTGGDFNGDQKVDGLDYVAWLNNYGSRFSLPTQNPLGSYFPYGIFEDGNMWKGTAARTTLQNDLTNLKNHNIMDILFTNGTFNLDILDSNGAKVIAAPMDTLNPQWWDNTTVTVNLASAEQIAQPIINSFNTHASIKGYNLVDDADGESLTKLTLMAQAFTQLDSARPAMVTAASPERFKAINTPIYETYLYPARTTNVVCDFNSKSIYGRYVNNLDQAMEVEHDILEFNRPNATVLRILQTHGTSPDTDPSVADVNTLRTPVPEELRIQNWLALSHGTKGIYWFIFKTQQFWTGLQDSPLLYSEVSRLASRVKPLSPTLLGLQNSDKELFTIQPVGSLLPPNQPVIHTLLNKATNKWYVIAVNHSCSPQNLIINSNFYSGSLKNLETGTMYTLNQTISFQGGDGMMFEVVGTPTIPPHQQPTNLALNGSFESGTSTDMNGWLSRSNISRDASIGRTGQASLKISGPAASNYFAIPLTQNLKPNTKYSISFWVKTNGITNSGVGSRFVHLSPSMGIALPPQSTKWVTGTSDWTHVTDELYTFVGMTQSQFQLQYDLSAGGTAWVDDVSICESNVSDCSGLFNSSVGSTPTTVPTPVVPSATPTHVPITPIPSPSPTANPIVSNIPHYMPNFNESVESWWQNHPFNPSNPNAIPVGGIQDPTPVVNVKQQFAGDIQAAVNSLPSSGGTLFFDPGEYENNISIVGRSNIHFISNGGAVIQGPANGQIFLYSQTHPSSAVQSIVGCDLAANYDSFDNALVNTGSASHSTAVACLQNLKGDFYFKNLTFDGGGTAYTALRLAAVANVVFDNDTFQNYLDPQAGHPGLVSAHEGDDNIWFRNCTFSGPNRYAVYLDGLHGGGIINSTISGYFGSGGILLLTNDDYSFDLNSNGTFEPSEQRNGNYIVVEGNQINTNAQAVAATTANTLIRKNTVPSFLNSFAHFSVRNSNRGTTYQFYGNHVIGNHSQDMLTFFTIDSANSCDPAVQTCAKVGKYIVSDNVIQNAIRFQALITEGGPVDGPNVVQNNCINGVCTP